MWNACQGIYYGVTKDFYDDTLKHCLGHKCANTEEGDDCINSCRNKVDTYEVFLKMS